MKRNRVLAGVAVLMVALLVAGLLVRERGAAARRPSGNPGAPAEFRTAKAPARDFPRRTGYTILPPAEGPAAAAQENPPHPLDAEIAAREARWKPWRGTRVDLNFTDMPLAEVLADLERRYGLKFLVVPGVDLARRQTTFKVMELAADQSIDLIFKMADLKWVLGPDGTVVVLEKDMDASPWAAKDSPELTAMETALEDRTRNRRQDEKDDKADAFLESVRGRTLAKEIPPAGVYDSLDTLQETVRLNMVISARARQAFKDDLSISALPAGRLLQETFDAWSREAGLEWKVENGVLFFGPPEEIAPAKEKDAKRRADRKERDKALSALLARRVTIGGENLAIRQVAALLEPALGVSVRCDPETWHRTVRLSLEPRERPALDIVRIVQAAAPVEVWLRDGVLWFLGPTPPPFDPYAGK